MMSARSDVLRCILAVGAVSLLGCAPDAYMIQHRQEGRIAKHGLAVVELKDVVTSIRQISSERRWKPLPAAFEPMGEGSYRIKWPPNGACYVDVYPDQAPGSDSSFVRVLCHTIHRPGAFDHPMEDDVLDAIQAAVKERLAKHQLAASAGMGRENSDSATRSPAKAIVSDVDAPKYRKQEDENLFAVVVGVEKYRNLPPAEFAERDVEAVRAHLMALGIPARNIFFAADQDATRASLVKAVHTWLPSRINGDSTVFFYYSGHGAPDPESGQAYLLPIDGDPEALADTAYSLKSLYHSLGQLKAKRIVVALDSCFSGAGGRSVLASGVKPLVTKIDIPDMARGNIVTLAASRNNQISGSMDEQGHGAFTYYFLKGLNGEAVGADGSVTIQALYDYLKPKVQDAARLHNHDQTPELAVGPEASAQLKLR